MRATLRQIALAFTVLSQEPGLDCSTLGDEPTKYRIELVGRIAYGMAYAQRLTTLIDNGDDCDASGPSWIEDPGLQSVWLG